LGFSTDIHRAYHSARAASRRFIVRRSLRALPKKASGPRIPRFRCELHTIGQQRRLYVMRFGQTIV
jgi:hypothetical protein